MATYDKLPQCEERDRPLTSPDAQSSIGFAKAALTFDHMLQDIRHKDDAAVTAVAAPSRYDGMEKQTVVPSEAEVTETPSSKEVILGRSIRFLLAIKVLITALLSLSIAFFQGRAFIVYNNTRSTEGAWPEKPFLAPTIILLSIAIAAFVFDVCLVIAYLFPGRRAAKKAIKVAASAYWVVTTAKTAGYALTTLFSRAGHDFAIEKETYDDLWSWTCDSPQAEQFASVNQCESNCKLQAYAWYFCIANIAIEILGFIVSKLSEWQKSIANKKTGGGTTSDAGGQDDGAKLEEMKVGVDSQIAQLMPQSNST